MTTDTGDHPGRSDELAASLAKARKGAGLTQTDLAEQAGWVKSGKTKVSKIEGNKQLPDEDDINAWASVTGVTDRLRAQWLTMASARANLQRSYRKRGVNGQQQVQKAYSDLATETTSFRFFEMTFIPRYLQVPEYTRAVLQEHHDKHGTINDVAGAAQERQESVKFLYDASKQFTFLIDEPVLRKRRFQPSIMRPQLDRLMSAIGLGNVRLGIYPSLSEPVGSLTESSFELFDDVGYIETALEDAPRLLANDVVDLEKLLDRYWLDAAEGVAARRIILDAINALPDE